jgi:hypothetical protein
MTQTDTRGQFERLKCDRPVEDVLTAQQKDAPQASRQAEDRDLPMARKASVQRFVVALLTT